MSLEDNKLKNFMEILITEIVTSNPNVRRLFHGTCFDFSDFIDKKRKFDSMEILQGFSTSIFINSQMLMRISDKNRVFTNRNARHKILDLYQGYRKKNLPKSEIVKRINDDFAKKSVYTTYGKTNFYRINSVDFDKNINNVNIDYTRMDPETKQIKVESTISLKNYYKTVYNIEIKDEKQPLFTVKAKMPQAKKKLLKSADDSYYIYLIPELVNMCGIDDLDKNDRQKIIQLTKISPTEKLQKITKGMGYFFKNDKKNNRKSPKEVMNEWGIQFERNFKELEAKVLPMPMITFRNRRENVRLNNNRFSYLGQIKEEVSFTKKNTIVFSWKNAVNLQDYLRGLESASRSLGINFTHEIYTQVFRSTEEDSFYQELQTFMKKSSSHLSSIDMILIYFDNNTSKLYKIIKKVLLSEAGITSQCMLDNGKRSRNMSYYSGVLTQMVAKRNKENYSICFDEKYTKYKTMIVGVESKKVFDHIHYTVIATSNRNFDLFNNLFEKANLKNKYEAGETLSDMIVKLIDSFGNKKLVPDRIVIYRKGGNEGSNTKILDEEAKIVVNNINKIYDNKIRVAFICINTNNDMKGYKKIESERSGKEPTYLNPPAGTVIDSELISENKFNFYMNTNEVGRGTGKFSQHTCLYNSIAEFDREDFYILANNLSYLYWNFSGAVPVPNVLKMAERASKFNSTVLDNEKVHEKVKNSPFYL